MDVLETEVGLEVVLDLPGIEAHAVTVTHRDGAVVIAGYKRPTRCHQGQAAFHLAERSFGRFSRGVKLGGAFDPSRATATLAGGELRVVIPRVDEKRGREIRIRIDTPERDPTRT
jgi:HSP20 family molecular chaperone IbpA